MFRGFRVVTASSGAEAIRMAHQPQRPTLILMDLRMSDVDGTEAMQVLRRDPAFARVPIIALTAHALREEQEAALRSGFDAVVAKPCLPDELVRHIELFLTAGGEPSIMTSHQHSVGRPVHTEEC
jgi:CheY-like chemotaxis protein